MGIPVSFYEQHGVNNELRTVGEDTLEETLEQEDI
jgi:hypothetical protein